MEWYPAPDIESEIRTLVDRLHLTHIKPNRVFCFRSRGSSSRARARIWGFARIWQQALNAEPAYCLEILAEKYDRLSKHEQTRTLVHELAHIPKNFSGSLIAHTTIKGKSFEKRAELLFFKLFDE